MIFQKIASINTEKTMSKRINRAYSVSNVLTKKFDLLDYNGKWLDSFGKPDRAFSATIWGNRTNGKTAFAIAWAKYMTNFGKVAYNSREEGLSQTIQAAMERNFMDALENSFLLLSKEPFEETFERMMKPKSPSAIFLDSIQTPMINKNLAIDFMDAMKEKKKSVIWVSQAKGKEPKGSVADDIAYYSDIKIWVEGYKAFPDGRLNGGGEPFVIYPQKAAKYWNEII